MANTQGHRHELHMSCSEKLATDQQRDFVKNFLRRSVPGFKFAFMNNGSLREGVKIQRFRTKLKVTV